MGKGEITHPVSELKPTFLLHVDLQEILPGGPTSSRSDILPLFPLDHPGRKILLVNIQLSVSRGRFGLDPNFLSFPGA